MQPEMGLGVLPGVSRRGYEKGLHDGEGSEFEWTSAPTTTPVWGSEGQQQIPPSSNSTSQPGLLRSLLAGRARTPSPTPSPTSSASPVLQALTTGMRQNQELQAQALSRSPEYPANELVKPGTTTLNPLPEATSTAESALKFQDWVEVSGAAMADVSEQSSEWRGSVTKVVEEAYTRWLSATPLERLNITVVGAKELNEGRWIRVNARVATMLLGSMQEDVKRLLSLAA